MSSSSSLIAEQSNIGDFPYEQVTGGGDVKGSTFAFGDSESAASEAARQLAQTLEAARAEGEARARILFEEQIARERQQLCDAIRSFARERDGYYQKVEGEVVQLALAIARKILHREAQMDPLVLAGIVRVALDKLESNTGVMVRVHPQNATEWRDFFSRNLESRDLPEVIEDPTLPTDRCTLQTSLGTTALGVDLQLKEIEQGLMDLLAHRPQLGQ